MIFSSTIVFSLTLSVAGFLSGYVAGLEDPLWSPFEQDTCQGNNKNCPNACDNANDGSTCCFCDNTKNFQMSVCSCCPRDTICCPPNDDTKTRGSLCCPVGSTCLKNGRCQRIQEDVAVYGTPVCSPTCSKDAFIRITCDNYFHLYFDGKPQTLNFPGDWTQIDELRIPEKTRIIAVAGENSEFEAGFLVKFDNADFDTTAPWICTNVAPEGDWTKEGFDTSSWWPAVKSVPNVPKTQTSQREQVKGMPANANWFWSNMVVANKPTKTRPMTWNRFCFCIFPVRRK